MRQKDNWQTAAITGEWTFAGCMVVPGFRFKLIPPEFDIPT